MSEVLSFAVTHPPTAPELLAAVHDAYDPKGPVESVLLRIMPQQDIPRPSETELTLTISTWKRSADDMHEIVGQTALGAFVSLHITGTEDPVYGVIID